MAPTQDAPTCGECGAVIGNVELHTAWHAGVDQDDLRAAILGFLDAIDPAQLEAAVLELDGDGDPMSGALAVLKDQAARLP